MTQAHRDALIAYYRVGIDGLQHVKGRTIKALMDMGYLTGHGFTPEGKALAKQLSDEEHEKIMTCGKRVNSMSNLGPGKFEGCMRYAPYFYEMWNEGFADSDHGTWAIFKVTAEDKAKFPELKKRKWVRIAEDSNGFVYNT